MMLPTVSLGSLEESSGDGTRAESRRKTARALSTRSERPDSRCERPLARSERPGEPCAEYAEDGETPGSWNLAAGVLSQVMRLSD